MKKIILLLSAVFLILGLSQPALTLAGASNGLMIWFQKLLPTLLPFLIIVNLLQNADIFDSIINHFPKCKYIVTVMAVAIPGFLFGLPVGAKLTADFTGKGTLSPQTGNVLLAACNQLSPAFVGAYVMLQCFQQPNLIGVSYLILYLPPAAFAGCFLLTDIFKNKRISQRNSAVSCSSVTQKKASRFQTLFQIIDASILNGFETITRLGGYLILFGIICKYIETLLPVPDITKGIIMMLMEITSGIHYFSLCSIPFPQKYIIGMAALSFGGLCTHAQTFSVIADAPLSRRSYLLAKIFLGLLTILLSTLIIRILY